MYLSLSLYIYIYIYIYIYTHTYRAGPPRALRQATLRLPGALDGGARSRGAIISINSNSNNMFCV